MFKGMGDMAKMMKTAQEMQSKMAEMQEEMGNITVVGESGAGLVRATAKGELTALEIDPSIFHPDGKVVANTSETTNMAHFIDTISYQIFENILVDQRPRYAQFTDDGALLFVSAEIGGTVTVIDVNARKAIHKITFEIPGLPPEAIRPVGVKITADGSSIFVALGPANRVAVVNGKTFEVEDYLLVGQRVWQMAFTPDQKYLFTTSGNSNDITVIDVDRLKPIKSIQVGQQPWGVAVSPN